MKIKIPFAVLALLGIKSVFAASSAGITFANSMSDCNLLAGFFETTIDSQWASGWDNYELVTCYFPGLCPDGTVKNTCTWWRYLNVLCRDKSGAAGTNDPEIIILTNGLPNHCYYAETTPPRYTTNAGSINNYFVNE